MAPDLAPGWPAAPYKGLGFYTEADSPLFAGRDKDIVRCAATLAEWRTRLLLLHGSTGCGKSSFLRAGLIPHLESRSTGIAFARIESVDETSALFIRSTAEPLAKLANAIYRFAAREVTLSTPDGPHNLNLRAALPDREAHNVTAFLRAYGNKPDVLLQVLEKLSRLVPETVVLIIDQGEEVLTVDNTARGEKWRTLFFEFLSEFTESQIDLKLLIALRTEYLGRFAARLRRGLRDPRIVEYFLDELKETQIKEAMLRPTETTQVGTLGPPFEHYRFSFNKGVVDSIIAQLGRAAGGKLTAVQIVCGTLYDLVRKRDEPRAVTFEDLDSIGGVEGSIERFLDKQLLEGGRAANLSLAMSEEEIVRWKKVLHKLAMLQPDGTVTTDLKPETTLKQELAGSRFEFGKTANHLLETRVLREANVVDATTGALIRCFGLGHDTLGLVLRNWKVRHDRSIGDTPLHSSDFQIEDEAFQIEEEAFSLENGVGLCLSGGGYRSMMFHTGVLWRLYEGGMLGGISRISSVSASSLTAGVLALRWSQLSFDPGRLQTDFVPHVVAPLRKLAGETIDAAAVVGDLIPGVGIADRISAAYDEHLFHGATLQDLPDTPRFVIIATNLQSGALWRFMKAYMRDYRVGEVKRPTVPLARAVMASSATPPVLSPCEIRLSPDAFTPGSGADLQREPFTTKVLLTDGGVYDNLGLETVWKRYRTVLVSDAGGRMQAEAEPKTDWGRQAFRITDLIDNQVRGLRKRQLIDSYKTKARQGAYWGIRTNIADYGLPDALPCPAERTSVLAETPSRLKALDADLQERLINWGYAACDAAIRKFVDPSMAPRGFPYPAARV